MMQRNLLIDMVFLPPQVHAFPPPSRTFYVGGLQKGPEGWGVGGYPTCSMPRRRDQSRRLVWESATHSSRLMDNQAHTLRFMLSRNHLEHDSATPYVALRLDIRPARQ